MSNKFNKKILFIGMPDMALICLDGLVSAGANIVGVFGAKKNHPTYPIFKNATMRHGLNFLEYDSLKDEDFIEDIKALQADIAVVCSFNYRIPKILLDTVKDGFINVHPSLLPDYRGPNPYSAVLLNNEQETGVTLHFMDESFDTGDIIHQKKLPISHLETMGTLFNRLNLLAYEMLLEALIQYEEQGLSRIKQPSGEFKTAPAFEDSELNINYEKSALEINGLIRGLNPFLLARTHFRKTLVKILTAEVVELESPTSFEPGQIVAIENDKFYIATGKGLIAPTAMQFGTFFAGTSKEFIQILNPKIGEQFS